MKVQDVMTKDVRTTRPEALLKEAGGILAHEHFSGLPVVDCEGRVVGVLSEGDILFKERDDEPASRLQRWLLLPPTYLESKAEARTVAEAMSAPAITIEATRPVTEAASVMIDEGVNRLPVVDEDGTLVGIVTRADLVRVFVRSDEEIAAEIKEDVLRRRLWLDPSAVEVVVENGEVSLSGEVETRLDAELIPTLVGRIPGVVSVTSDLHAPSDDGGGVRDKLKQLLS